MFGLSRLPLKIRFCNSGGHVSDNTISPGFILTEATRRHMEAEPALKDKVLAKNMLKLLGEPNDVAYCATWLANDEASYVTGGNFPVDAGGTAW